MKKERKEQKELEENFNLFDNAEIVENIPSRIWFKNESKQKEISR